MATPGRLTASLTVNGEEVDPDEISKLLGAKPDRAHRVGDLVSSRSTSRRRTGHWSISTEGIVPETAPLKEHISELLARVTNDVVVWRALTTQHHARVFIGWFMSEENEGAAVEPSVLAELSRRSLTLDFDVYASAIVGESESSSALGAPLVRGD